MQAYKHILLSLLIILILLPTLFFPLSSDLAVFNLAGRTILKGEKLYTDFIDIKTPLIYLINSLNQIIFGHSEFSFRLFDFFWQIFTSASIIIVYYKLKKDWLTAYIASAIYCLLYATLHYSQTYQCEGFLGLAIIWLIFLQIKKSDKLIFNLLQGLILGFIISLKFTFVITLAALITLDLFHRRSFQLFLKKYALILLGLFFGILLFSFPLLDKRTFEGFLAMLDYLKHYNEFSYLSMNWLNYSLLLLTKFLSDSLSFFILFILIIGIYLSLSKKNELQTNYNDFLQATIIFGIFLFISVIIENKYHSYHFARFYVPLAIVSSFGLQYLFNQIKYFWQNNPLTNKILIIVVLSLAIIFSPLTRYVNLFIPAYYYLNDKKKYNDYYQRDDAVLLRNDIINIASKMKEIAKPEDNILIISIGSNAIYYFLETEDHSSFASSSFFLSKYIPDLWAQILNKDLQRARWIIVQTNDIHPLLTGHWHSSWNALQEYSNIKKKLELDYSYIEDIGPFKIFKKKN